jgi:hypothetical protein
MPMPPSTFPILPGLQWIPGVNAVEVQKSSELQIDAKTLAYTSSTDINIAQADLWKAINGLLGLTNDPAKHRYYLGAAHPLFTETIEREESDGDKIKTIIERIPMLWVDSIKVMPLDDHHKGQDGESFPGDGGNPQMLHWKTCRLHVQYSNDPIHYSRLSCSWAPKLEQEYVQVGSLFWKDESKTGAAQYNDSAEFLALPTQKYARRCMTAEIQYSIAFYMNPTFPGCLPEWCDTAMPIPKNVSAEMKAEEERKLLGAVNKNSIELFPYFGDADKVKHFYPIIDSYKGKKGVFPTTDKPIRSLAAPAGTLLFADVSCTTEFRPWIFGNPLDNEKPTNPIGLRQMPLTFINFRLAYRRSGWNRFWNGLKMEYGKLWWKDAVDKTKKDANLFEERDFKPIQSFIRNNISWNPDIEEE